ncbi:MAG TPA: hypothetical protein VHA52_09710 [Candidatus Babeliaceae bacterium]|nr:hypothetical protein [Candidatus Babeliaceae bacterium]
MKRFFIIKTILLAIIFLSSNMHGEDNQKNQLATPEQIESSWLTLDPSDIPESFRSLFLKYLPLLTGSYNLSAELAKDLEQDTPKLLEALRSAISLTYTSLQKIFKIIFTLMNKQENHPVNNINTFRIIGVLAGLLLLLIKTHALGYMKPIKIDPQGNKIPSSYSIAGKQIRIKYLNISTTSTAIYWIFLELYKWIVIDKAIERAYEQFKGLVSSPSVQS